MSRSCLVPVQSLLTVVNSTSSAMFHSNVTKFTPLFEILFHVADRILELNHRENILGSLHRHDILKQV